jgi:uncharacterized protein YfeS
MKFYFDDPETGIARETSHPNYTARLKEELYYDCLEECSPFGNDDGADVLYNLEDWYRETEGKGDIMEWLFGYVDSMGYKYSSEDTYNLIDRAAIEQIENEDPLFMMSMDNSIIGTAFGQYKITGTINERLKDAALMALARMKTIMDENEEFEGGVEAYDKMEADMLAL